MSKVNLGFVAPLFCALLMTCCVTSGNVAMKEQTQQSIDSAIQKGKTTKQEVTQKFGSADAVSLQIVVMKFGHTDIQNPNLWQEILSHITSFL